jgi:hypothetical protein
MKMEEQIQKFFEFESSLKKEIRGGIVMYDVKGHYKFLTLPELYEYWIKLETP